MPRRAGAYDSPVAVAQTCRRSCLSSGMVDEAYRRYGLLANRTGTYVAWYAQHAAKKPRSRRRRYSTTWWRRRRARRASGSPPPNRPGCSMRQSRWRSARRAHRPLSRAARDFAEKNPPFALEAGMAAVHWLVAGWLRRDGSGRAGCPHTLAAADAWACAETTRQRIRDLVAKETGGERFVTWGAWVPSVSPDAAMRRLAGETATFPTDAAFRRVDADELRALIRELLPWFDDRLHAGSSMPVIDHAATVGLGAGRTG